MNCGLIAPETGIYNQFSLSSVEYVLRAPLRSDAHLNSRRLMFLHWAAYLTLEFDYFVNGNQIRFSIFIILIPFRA